MKTQTDTIADAIQMAFSEVNGGDATISYLGLDDASVAKPPTRTPRSTVWT